MSETIAFIPVRGGSKSIPKKNIKKFYGSPLIFWCLQAAVHAKTIDRVVVATDDDEIESVVLGFELDKVEIYRREAENASDTASTESVMLEYLNKTKPDDQSRFILIQATSPFLTSLHLEEGVTTFENKECQSLLSAVENKRFMWSAGGVSANYDYQQRPRRQDFKGQFMENGAFYISTVKNILSSGNRLSGKVAVYQMPEFTGLELDEPGDWKMGELLMQQHGYKRLFPKVKLFATDVDGVLTDASMYYTSEGDVMKRFNTHDGMGLQLIQKQGVKTAIITSEDTEIVKKRAEKLGVDFLYQGKRDGGKLQAINEMCRKLNIDLKEVAYIGDDINCLAALEAVGVAACPANATPKVKALPGIIPLNKKGGDGAVREFIELLLD